MARAFALSLEIWLAAVMAVVLVRLVNGRIPLRGLLAPRLADLGAGASFDRFQHLWVTLGVLGAYVAQAISQAQMAAPQKAMPDASPALIGALVTSHAVYLGGKLVRNL